MQKKRTKKRRGKRGRKGLKKALWDIFSKYIRLRDKGICFTCGAEKHWKELQAGHFVHGVLDYDEMNINAQCVKCNLYNSGNGVEYTLRLIRKYGLEKVEDLKARATLALAGELYEDEWLKERIQHYRKLVEQMKKKLELEI